MDFVTAMRSETVTENGMPTPATSGKDLVDLFFKQGASRDLDSYTLQRLFAAAYKEDPANTLRCMFYNRDIRGGQGERRSFRIFFSLLCMLDPAAAIKNIHNVPFYGRWDDLFAAIGTSVEPHAFAMIANGLIARDPLCAKWMPREHQQYANVLRAFLGLNWHDYRKLLAGNTAVVETLMCSKRWSDVNYSHVPSVAIHKYRKAWARNDALRYASWITELERPDGEVKINAGAIFPHTLVSPLMYPGGQNAQIEAQWKALPNYMPMGRKVLPMCDVSGSMSNNNGLPMEVSVALGLYIAERNLGPFHQCVLTFSSTPAFHVANQPTLYERVQSLLQANWDMTTNLQAAFTLVLSKAVSVNLPAAEMPDTLLILSDMQFDEADGSYQYERAQDMIRAAYEAAGYQLPRIVYWNLRTSAGVPVRYTESGTALVSGFSPSILKFVLGSQGTPLDTVLATLGSARYEQVVV